MEITQPLSNKLLQALPVVAFLLAVLTGCGVRLISIQEQPSAHNVLIEKISVVTNENTPLFVRYWEEANPVKTAATAVSATTTAHEFSLIFLKPATAYQYQVVAPDGKPVSEIRAFHTKELPLEIREMVMPAEIPDTLPQKFLKGYSLIARRDLPGQVYMITAKGEIAWYHTIKDAGFKVAHFTKQSTVLSIVAPLSYPTSYGDEILELSLAGDTLFHLKKGEKGFDKTIHHEIFYNDQHQLVTLTQEKKLCDLSKVGGAKADTVTGDGILILDEKGNKVWSWSVFDVLDPLSDPDILKNKADWLHANSLSVDADGNYLLSFYLSGQIWKIHAKTGKLIWKLGRGGDFSFPNGRGFYESHAAYRTAKNQLLLFENGTNRHQSRVLAYTLDETHHKALSGLCITLPPYLYSERMGSAYAVGDSNILVCSAQANSVSLLSPSGKILWRVRTGFMPYRAEFIEGREIGSAD